MTAKEEATVVGHVEKLARVTRDRVSQFNTPAFSRNRGEFGFRFVEDAPEDAKCTIDMEPGAILLVFTSSALEDTRCAMQLPRRKGCQSQSITRAALPALGL